jgi:hypothetical protein
VLFSAALPSNGVAWFVTFWSICKETAVPVQMVLVYDEWPTVTSDTKSDDSIRVPGRIIAISNIFI